MATPNLSEIVTTTLYNRSRMIADNVTENNALLTKLKARGKVKPFSGGREIVQEFISLGKPDVQTLLGL